MGATVEGSTTRTTDATPEQVWHHVCEGHRVATWWPKAERAEDVQGGLFTLLLRSSRGVPVRTDWQVETSKKPTVQRWVQQLRGTPFEKALKQSAVEVRIEPGDGGGCTVTVVVERELVQRGMIAGRMGRKSCNEQARLTVDGLMKTVAAG